MVFLVSFLLNAILIKGKFTLFAWVLLFIFILGNASFQCNTTAGTPSVEWPKLKLCLLIHMCMCISFTRTIETLHKTNSLFISLLALAHSTSTLPPASWWVNEASEERELCVALSCLFFFVVIFSISNSRGVTLGKKDVTWLLDRLCFSQHHCLLSELVVSFWFTQKAWPCGGCQHPHLFRCRCNTLAFFETHCIPAHCGFTAILCSWDIVNVLCKWDSKEWQTHISRGHPVLVHMLRCPIRFVFRNISLQIKLLRISRWRQQSIKPSKGPFEPWALCDCTSGTLRKLAQKHMHTPSPMQLICQFTDWPLWPRNQDLRAWCPEPAAWAERGARWWPSAGPPWGRVSYQRARCTVGLWALCHQWTLTRGRPQRLQLVQGHLQCTHVREEHEHRLGMHTSHDLWLGNAHVTLKSFHHLVPF